MSSTPQMIEIKPSTPEETQKLFEKRVAKVEQDLVRGDQAVVHSQISDELAAFFR
jgi:hypothetical protein